MLWCVDACAIRGEAQKARASLQDGEACNLGCEPELLLRLRQRESRAFDELVQLYGPRLLAVARTFLTCEQESCDAVQDTFLSAFRSLHSFRGKSLLSTWLHRIVVNACLMRLRAKRREAAVEIESLWTPVDATVSHLRRIARRQLSPCDAICNDEMREHIRTCIDELPARYGEILVLRDIEERDTAETANLLGISESLVKTRLHRGRQALRTLLESRFIER